jgi:three-Cys-motif partner protein
MANHRFGGRWTQDKLECLGRYLQAYMTALKYTPFKKTYIDAFAGTGYRGRDEPADPLLFELPDLADLARGSAVIALEVLPSFDKYIFIEQKRRRFEELTKLADEYPDKRPAIEFRQADANVAIRDICRETDWRSSRAVLFLDPYGMQVEWKTLEAVAATKAIDTWILFPVGMGVDRLLPKGGEIPVEFQTALDRVLGEPAWRNSFYRSQPPLTDLFGHVSSEMQRTADVSAIEQYFLGRLASIFAGVAPHGLPLRNSRGYLMYLLCFACGNPRGKDIALRIANHLLEPGK